MSDLLTQTVKHSTNYYRKNKEKRKIVHKCPHCLYETTGPKSCIKVHIWSKHTPEHKRPFQCFVEGCCRGFSQKINYQKHLKTVHNINIDLKINKNIAEYHIQLTGTVPVSKKIKNRIQYYKTHPIIICSDLNKIIPGTNDQIIKSNHIYYDSREKYITLKTINFHELKKKKVKKIKKRLIFIDN
jgi:hypothetical protein